MCRVLAYLGKPISLEHLLFTTDSSLVRQTYSPKMMVGALNLAGFGMAAWDDSSRAPEEPFIYRTTSMPVYDGNLRGLAQKIAPSCVVAHVRGVSWSPEATITEQNLHPFRYPGVSVTLAHNGHLREFTEMRHDLLAFIKPPIAQRIEGTTDSEWLYALLISQLDDPYGSPDPEEIIDATTRTLSIVRHVREKHDIRTSSPVNLFISTGHCLIVTRFSFDYGWYPDDDPLLETDLPYVALWYTIGEAYVEHDGEWMMSAPADRGPRSLIIASEPLTSDVSTWLEAPEYSILGAWFDRESLRLDARELAA
jgi:glutamine amidotransferase